DRCQLVWAWFLVCCADNCLIGPGPIIWLHVPQQAMDVTRLRFRHSSCPCIFHDYPFIRDVPLPILAIQRLLAEAVRNAEVRGEAIHSLPFVTSSVSATPEREAGGTDPAMGGFTDLTGSDLLVGGIHTIIIPDMDLQNVYVPQWSVTKESRLDDGHVCRKMMDEFAPLNFFAYVL
nr:hypothetical protein [Tanacetum cinerariifolium]